MMDYNSSVLESGYDCIPVMKECFDSLYDDLSRKLFFARLAVDVSPCIENIRILANLSGYDRERMLSKLSWTHDLAERQTPVYLYGVGAFGGWWCENLLDEHINIKAFFDQNYQVLKNCRGIPVLEPPIYNSAWKETIERDAMILITATLCEDEIYELLCQAGFPKERILPRISACTVDLDRQYFDFMDHYQGNGAFIDGGCCNGDTAIRFARLCENHFSKVFAFEPDAKNYVSCQNNMAIHNLQNVELIQAGLWKETTTLRFHALGSGVSYLSADGEVSVPVVQLDEIIKDEPVAFIKLDVEGAEMDALKGAGNTIRRDRPLCAICIYHKPGDMLAIAHYLKQLVPDYRFAIRHYAFTAVETVLYAFV